MGVLFISEGKKWGENQEKKMGKKIEAMREETEKVIKNGESRIKKKTEGKKGKKNCWESS